VLLHSQGEERHFDLMLEDGPALATWKMNEPPEDASADGILCQRIADHRRRYLAYEGPLSGDRGHVVRHDEGTCDVLRPSRGAWRVTFDGKRINGVFLIEKSDDQGAAWRLRRLSACRPSGRT
jgi:hypothetical protein